MDSTEQQHKYEEALEGEGKTKKWILDSDDACDTCQTNAAQGVIELYQEFASGHLYPPAHDGCGCEIEVEYEE